MARSRVNEKPPADQPLVLDPEMQRVRDMIELVAPTSLAILILGDTGAGKEVAAEWVHRASARPAAAFLKTNCAGLAESVIESELFGHEKGAFTGAVSARQGLFEAADGGTLFLDEVAELTPRTQAKLLRVLECGEIVRVGATTPRRVNVRFIAATHRDLERMVATGQFRQDLFFRLNGLTVRLPPLRERPSEILPLARLFVERTTAKLGRIPLPLSDGAIDALLRHKWPGNVRELKHVIERAVVMCRSTMLSAEHLGLTPPRCPIEVEPLRPENDGGDSRVARSDIRNQVRVFEKERILAVLAQTRGNQTMAARLLGVSRRTLTNKLNLYRIERPRKGRHGLEAAPLSGPPSRPSPASSRGETIVLSSGTRGR
jgi:two-component system response regulator AtoC